MYLTCSVLPWVPWRGGAEPSLSCGRLRWAWHSLVLHDQARQWSGIESPCENALNQTVHKSYPYTILKNEAILPQQREFWWCSLQRSAGQLWSLEKVQNLSSHSLANTADTWYEYLLSHWSPWRWWGDAPAKLAAKSPPLSLVGDLHKGKVATISMVGIILFWQHFMVQPTSEVNWILRYEH